MDESPRKEASPRRRALTPRSLVSPRDKKTVLITGDQKTLKSNLSRSRAGPGALMIVYGKPMGQKYNLHMEGEELVLGRDPSADLVVLDNSVSRKHARIVRDDTGRMLLEDLGGANGTFVNDVKLTAGSKVELATGVVVKVGATVLKYLPPEESHLLGSLSATARTDALTGALNRRGLMQTLEALCEVDDTVALLFFDLDRFKVVNDTYGHDCGDFVLKQVCAVVRPLCTANDATLGRYGGEEFCIVLSGNTLQEATALAERVRSAVEKHAFVHQDNTIPVTLSLGVAQLNDAIQSASALIKAADTALYAAKAKSRNVVVVSDKCTE